MIPQKAIERAIEGGWMLRDGFKAYKVELLPTAHPSVGYWISEGGNKAKYCERVDWEEIALDPKFWQALKFDYEMWSMYLQPGSSRNAIPVGVDTAVAYGILFVHHILNGKSTQKFWDEVLK